MFSVLSFYIIPVLSGGFSIPFHNAFFHKKCQENLQGKSVANYIFFM